MHWWQNEEHELYSSACAESNLGSSQGLPQIFRVVKRLMSPPHYHLMEVTDTDWWYIVCVLTP